MKVDIYTKIILTVIAVCLATIVLRDINIVSEAQAQVGRLTKEKVTKVQIVGIKKTSELPWDGLPIASDLVDPVHVKIINGVLDMVPVEIWNSPDNAGHVKIVP